MIRRICVFLWALMQGPNVPNVLCRCDVLVAIAKQPGSIKVICSLR